MAFAMGDVFVRRVPGAEIEWREMSGPVAPAKFVLHWSLSLLVAGSAELQLDRSRWAIEPHSLTIARAGQIGSIVRRRSAASRAITVTFLGEHEPLVERSWSAGGVPSVTHDPAVVSRVAALLAQAREPGWLAAEESVAQLATIALAHAPAVTPCSIGVARARQMIDDMPGADHRLDDLGSAAGVSKYHLIRMFSAQLGVTPHAYRNAVRVARARERLREGATVTDVARDLGFASRSHLAGAFRRVYGVTPAQYARAFASGHVDGGR